MIMKSYIDIYENLVIKINQSLKHDIKFIISCNESLAEHTRKNGIIQLLSKYGQEYGHKHKKELNYLLENLI